MWNRRATISSLAVCAVAIVSACADAPPTEPYSAAPSTPSLFGGPAPDPQTYDGHLDSHFKYIAQEVPGFGGYFYDANGALTVSMTAGASVAALSTYLPVQTFTVREASYSFLQLDEWRSRSNAVLAIDGVVYTDVDEEANRVRIGVENETAAADADYALRLLGIPSEATAISFVDPIIPMQTLRDRVRPLAGGLRISYPGFACTMGFNVRSPEVPGVHGFVIPSHCSEAPGVVTPTMYFQPEEPFYIGIKLHDLPFFTGGVCPAGRQCRWSDSMGGRYFGPGLDNIFGRVYRTTGLGSLVIDPNTSMFAIVQEGQFPILGDVMHKVGQTTGWTMGTVSGTCVNTNVSGTTITLLCQDLVSGVGQIVAGGDSGAPVFLLFGDPTPQPNIELSGMLWGGTADGSHFIFSAMNGIRFENIPPIGTSWWTCEYVTCCPPHSLSCPTRASTAHITVPRAPLGRDTSVIWPRGPQPTT